MAIDSPLLAATGGTPLFPAVEAMACGSPLLTSHTTSLPEVTAGQRATAFTWDQTARATLSADEMAAGNS